MQKKYEAPELTLVGQAEELVMGVSGIDGDLSMEVHPEFEFEED